MLIRRRRTALSKTPHALADGLMLVFQHPVNENKCCHYTHGRMRIQDRITARGSVFQLPAKELIETADIKTEGAMPLRKGAVRPLKAGPRGRRPCAITHFR
jgi:hypothetical protein